MGQKKSRHNMINNDKKVNRNSNKHKTKRK